MLTDIIFDVPTTAEWVTGVTCHFRICKRPLGAHSPIVDALGNVDGPTEGRWEYIYISHHP